MNVKVKALIAVILAAGIFGAGYLTGSRSVQSDWDKATLAQTLEDHQVLLVGMKDSFELGTQHEEQKQEIAYVTEEIIKKIPVYIKDTSTCPVLPDNYSVLYNAAAQAVNAGISSGQPNDGGATP